MQGNQPNSGWAWLKNLMSFKVAHVRHAVWHQFIITHVNAVVAHLH